MLRVPLISKSFVGIQYLKIITIALLIIESDELLVGVFTKQDGDFTNLRIEGNRHIFGNAKLFSEAQTLSNAEKVIDLIRMLKPLFC